MKHYSYACERSRFVKQALDGRCSLAAAHVTYVQSLKSTGTAFKKFVEPEAPIESSLYTSTSATPEPFALTEKTLSQFSFSSQFVSQHIDTTETFSPSPSPPNPSQFQANNMKFRGSSSNKVEENPHVPIIGTVISSNTSQNATPHSTGRPETSALEDSSLEPGTPPRDYFGFFHPIDHQFSFKEGKGMQRGLENADNARRLGEEEGVPELEDDEENLSSHGSEDSQDSEDEFDEPATDTLIRSFENLNRIHDHDPANASPATAMSSAGNAASESENLNGTSNSPGLSPLKAASTVVILPDETIESLEKENSNQNKVAPKDFFSSMKDIEFLFVKASESGKEIPRMLEANKLHFRPIFPGKESGSTASSFLKSCFSCGEDPSQVPEVLSCHLEPAQNSVKYLTWHRTTSSQSSSSRNPLGASSKDDIEDLKSNLFDDFCMISSSHASTLDRLYAWERKLYDEVKASEIVRREYDLKCKILRQMESDGERLYKIDKTRSVVKDLHSRIGVAIYRINSISKRIEELRDNELQPQLEELIEGLSRMWKVMFECHKVQFQIISVAYISSHTRVIMQTELRQQITAYLENELYSLSSSFTEWISAQKSYLGAINGWLFKCVSIPQKSSRRKRRPLTPNLRNHGPPIYVTCGVWLEKLEALPMKDVADSIKALAAETARFLPLQEKNQGKGANRPRITTSWKPDEGSESADNLLRDEASEDWVSGFVQFQPSLVTFLGQLNTFADSAVKMYTELDKAVRNAKSICDQQKSQFQFQSQSQFV
ncbi:Protein of unknown function (DUF630 and DUF632) [Quillaja saponaria]|uniref:Uncharacterized protein n=1 Tax=Quillaja saponaria TaxID=32244 RepID=A0AAD7PLQ1_QUISA|nr:Protein of unknown function (DUF630 and DUF632) [Quillaja saponaria]